MFDFLSRKKAPETYRGDLAQTALAEMLYVIYRHGTAGVLEVSHEETVKCVHVRNGACVHATSTEPGDRLLVWLKTAGRLGPEQFALLSRAPGENDRDRGALLIDRGVLSPAELYHALSQRVESIVWSLFWMEAGKLTFRVHTDDSALVHIHIPIRQAIVHGIRRAPSARSLTARLGRKGALYAPQFEVSDLVDVALDRDEYRLLTLVNGQRSLYELCAQGPCSPAENAKLLYALFATGLIVKLSDGAASE